MENAVNALKFAFAVFIFILGLTILFNMSSQAREVAGILITEADKTTYYEYYEGGSDTIDGNGNRIVAFEDIIPAMYRYSEENYAVTIIDKDGKIKARYDLDTEAICNNWKSTTDSNKYTFVSEVYKVFKEVNDIANKIGAHTIKEDDIFTENCYKDTTVERDPVTNEIIHAEIKSTIDHNMEDLFRTLYGQINASPTGKIRRDYYCYWIRNNGMDISKNRFRFISE